MLFDPTNLFLMSLNGIKIKSDPRGCDTTQNNTQNYLRNRYFHFYEITSKIY